MDIIKSLTAILADPLSYALLFLLLCWRVRSLSKYWPLTILYLTLMSTPIVHKGLVSLWAVPDRVNSEIKYDAAVLLLGVSNYKWHLDYTPDERNGYCALNQNASRVGYVVQQYREGRIFRILLGRNIIGGFDETACVIDLLNQQGVDSKNIVVMGDVTRTLDEIRETKRFVNQSPSVRILMVTSTNHMRRALAFVKKEDFNIDYYSTNRPSIKNKLKEFIPSSKWLTKNASLFYEMLAYLGYKVAGKL